MAPSGHPAYSKDEKVLCFHHELLYEAKVLDYKQTDPNDRKSPFQYRVHYKGWKNTYVKSDILTILIVLLFISKKNLFMKTTQLPFFLLLCNAISFFLRHFSFFSFLKDVLLIESTVHLLAGQEQFHYVAESSFLKYLISRRPRGPSYTEPNRKHI